MNRRQFAGSQVGLSGGQNQWLAAWPPGRLTPNARTLFPGNRITSPPTLRWGEVNSQAPSNYTGRGTFAHPSQTPTHRAAHHSTRVQTHAITNTVSPMLSCPASTSLVFLVASPLAIFAGN